MAAGDDKAVRDFGKPAGRIGAVQAGKGARSDRDVGHALRSVYVETVNEDIPSELLDLLGKLD